MAQKFRFRNLFAKSHTKWEDIQPLGGATDGYIIAGNSKFIAFPLQGGMGSTLGVLSYKQSGRVKQISQIRAHTSHITDFKFLPYQENTVATASQDATIKFWHIDDDNSKDIDTPLTTLSGHALKINLIAPHNSAKGILASASYDKTIKVWNTEESKDVLTINQGSNYALCLEWSHDGSILGSTWNDKQVRIIDPRQQTFVKEFGAHQSTRAQKMAFLGNTSYFVTTGFDQVQKRQLFLWDIRNTSSNIKVEGCSQAQGVLHPYYDSDLGILYLNGKGEGLVRLFEYQNGTLTTHQNDVMVTDTTKGYGFLPKYAVDTHQNEVCRLVKLCSKYAEAVSIIYPRRSQDFQEDLYPDCSIDFSLTAQQWLEGQNAQPKVAAMKDLKLSNHTHHSKPATTTHNQTLSHQVHHTTTTTNVTQPQRKSSNTQTSHTTHHVKTEAKVEAISEKENSHPNNQQDVEHQQLQKAIEENKDYLAKNENLKSDLAQKDAEITELKSQVEYLHLQVQERIQNEQSVSVLTQEVEQLKQNLVQSETQNTELKEQLQAQTVTFQQEKELLNLQIQEFKQKYQDCIQLVQTLSQQEVSLEGLEHDQLLQSLRSLAEKGEQNSQL
ncbi:coronin (macronuclear) [Tetrahymena thermophila SB210]|uniref:Coronin n=1 Tax=Tetrahymena thermophila (strain SB210) TaxID=312017 RepID=I7MIA8_TETTS|nr:coronin [Tetrahymena thermophila SB210]EAR92825.3 coronin [Tetrahymena thermophila SB210]|eukprot:XP_001013070.3 coronin [Tetrahymena thermophila SB210]